MKEEDALRTSRGEEEEENVLHDSLFHRRRQLSLVAYFEQIDSQSVYSSFSAFLSYIAYI